MSTSRLLQDGWMFASQKFGCWAMFMPLVSYRFRKTSWESCWEVMSRPGFKDHLCRIWFSHPRLPRILLTFSFSTLDNISLPVGAFSCGRTWVFMFLFRQVVWETASRLVRAWATPWWSSSLVMPWPFGSAWPCATTGRSILPRARSGNPATSWPSSSASSLAASWHLAVRFAST